MLRRGLPPARAAGTACFIFIIFVVVIILQLLLYGRSCPSVGLVAGCTHLESCDSGPASFNISCSRYKRLLVEKEDVSTARVPKSFHLIPRFLLLYGFAAYITYAVKA